MLEDDMDSDNDGIEDYHDNCPAVSNPNQEDSNSDGLGDACEEDLSIDILTDELMGEFFWYKTNYSFSI